MTEEQYEAIVNNVDISCPWIYTYNGKDLAYLQDLGDVLKDEGLLTEEQAQIVLDALSAQAIADAKGRLRDWVEELFHAKLYSFVDDED